MKKVLFLAAAALCTKLSFAQTKTAPVSFGLKAGLNIAKLKVTNSDESYGSLLGLNAGAFATIHATSTFAVQPELTWSTLGAKEKAEGITSKIVLNYLTLPVLAKYTFATSGFSLYAGPQIGFLLSANSKVSSDEGSIKTSIKDQIKSTDFAGVAGVEFEIPNTKLNISGRYQLGLSNIAKDSDGDSKVKNNAAIFTIGYRFN